MASYDRTITRGRHPGTTGRITTMAAHRIDTVTDAVAFVAAMTTLTLSRDERFGDLERVASHIVESPDCLAGIRESIERRLNAGQDLKHAMTGVGQSVIAFYVDSFERAAAKASA